MSWGQRDENAIKNAMRKCQNLFIESEEAATANTWLEEQWKNTKSEHLVQENRRMWEGSQCDEMSSNVMRCNATSARRGSQSTASVPYKNTAGPLVCQMSPTPSHKAHQALTPKAHPILLYREIGNCAILLF